MAARRRASSWIDWRTGSITDPRTHLPRFPLSTNLGAGGNGYGSDRLDIILTINWLGWLEGGKDRVYRLAFANDGAERGMGEGHDGGLLAKAFWADLQDGLYRRSGIVAAAAGIGVGEQVVVGGVA